MHGARDKGSPNLRLVAGGAMPVRVPTVPAGREDEEALPAACLAGDLGAFGELVRRSQAIVIAVARRYTRLPDDARDLARDAFLRAFRAARRALQRDPQRAVPFRRWVVRGALELARGRLRTEVVFAGSRLEQLGSDGVRAADAPLRGQRTARARAETLQLSRREREVLTLRIDAELPFSEIAEILRITEGAAVVSFHDAAQRLRDAGAWPVAARNTCGAHEVLLSLRAAGALERGERARVEAHLAGCSACSIQADATAEVLALAALVPTGEGERAAFDDFPASTVAALERSERHRAVGKHVLVAIGVVAVAHLTAAVALLGKMNGLP
jgi:RNA polymerase sigma-70 factor (ECF subfamily)